jgi:magnesium-transporting ATPase (P-type)
VTTSSRGISEEEARRRLAERGPIEPAASSRSYRSIVRANTLTVFNAILVAFGVLTLIFADWRDALFLFILVANSGIGIAQEVRAKRSLDRLAALVAPRATVVRDGSRRELLVEDVVPGDLVELRPGDQVVADGSVEEASGLLLDESILTGESRPVTRAPGENVRSGSFAVEDSGAYTVTAVGADSYAERLTGEAREFRHPRSPLETTLNQLLLLLVAVMVPLGAALGYALWERNEPFRSSVETAVAGAVSMVPEGLILLVSITYAAAALRMTRRGALAQQLNAIESIASVDVVCLDKTGTLTEPSIRVVETVPAAGVGHDELEEALGRYAASAGARNTTLDAIAASFDGLPERPRAEVPFSARRRWSGLQIGPTSYVLGAPERFPLDGLHERVRTEAASGRRVVAFGQAEGLPEADDESNNVLQGVRPLGLIVLGEQIRPEAPETVQWFLDAGVELKVLSGDAPETVAAIARDVGIPLGRIEEGTNGRPDVSANVVGRIPPEGKRDFVEALRDSGRYVAMVGDGVNDVPALKAARLGIAQGSGAQMAKSVADVVLVGGEFGVVPPMVSEGRNILRNIQRVTKLFVAKSVFAAFLILSIGLTREDYPLLPRHLTIAAGLTIGVPAFFLALAPSDGEWRLRRFFRDVSQFAVPTGVAAGFGVLSAFLLARNVFELSLVSARTAATTVLVIVGLYLVLVLEATSVQRLRRVAGLCGAMLALYVLVLALPSARDFFMLVVPGFRIVLATAIGVTLAIGFLWTASDRFWPLGARFENSPNGSSRASTRR